MIDILDVVLAKKKSFTGETESLVRQAREAMAQANEVAAILEDAQAANSAAQAANEAAQAAEERASEIAADFEELKSDFTSAAEELTNEIVDEKIQEALTPVQTSITELEDTIEDNYEELNTAISGVQTFAENAIDITIEDANTAAAKIKKAKISKNGQLTSVYDVEKNYTNIGNNEDGSMTQKAIKNYVDEIKTEIENEINNIDFSNLTFSTNDAGHFVVIGEDGKLTVSQLTENDDTPTITPSNPDSYDVTGTLGLEIDYANKNFTRLSDAINKTAGTNFNSYSMYGGRMRCNVSDDGTITAFYGDSNYKEDGSNGQVMVYQPKFYYRREPIIMTESEYGNSIRKENLYISNEPKTGFKLHPLFINENNEEIDYVLLPAYQGTLYDFSNNSYIDSFEFSNLIIDFENDKLSSIGGKIPIASNNNSSLTVEKAEQLAKNRGTGWHITNMAAESANQMLFIIEYGQLNGQTALGKGVINIPKSGKNYASWVGSTSYLGNTSGVANKTSNGGDGVRIDYTDSDKIAVSYRGLENPWGNLWRFIGGINIVGNGDEGSGYPYICKNFNYNITSIDSNYESTGFRLPSRGSWISAMGYKNPNYDWVFMPSECQDANSLLPVGDNIWIVSNLNGINGVILGGSWETADNAGLFCYGCDHFTTFSKYSFGANLMFIPQKNSIYNQNITKWRNKFGGD